MEFDGMNQAALPTLTPGKSVVICLLPRMALLFPVFSQSQSVTSLEGGWG